MPRSVHKGPFVDEPSSQESREGKGVKGVKGH